MAIRPISPISYANGYNKVSFESRRKEDNAEESSYSTSLFMKSIPVATLIAMSPLNSVQAQTVQSQPKENTVMTQTYKNPIKDGCNILFISNDGNDDDIELIALQHGKNYTYTRNIRGIDTKLLKRENFKQYLDTLKTVNETVKYGDEPPKKQVKYVVTGPRVYDVYVENAESGKLYKHSSGRSEHVEYVIDKELYDYLLQFMEKNSVVTEDRTRTIQKTDMFEDIFGM